MKRIIGIDPGKNGGIVALERGFVIFKSVMPLDKEEFSAAGFSDILEELARNNGSETWIYLDRVGAYAMSQSSAFTFGQIYGKIELLCAMSLIPVVYIDPPKWSKEIHAGIDRRLKPKEKSLLALQQLFPKEDMRATPRAKKPHDGLVDALLIAEYGRREQDGLITNKVEKELGL